MMHGCMGLVLVLVESMECVMVVDGRKDVKNLCYSVFSVFLVTDES